MKIIIVNYRFFVSGGPERYLFNVIKLLQEHGHTVAPFSIKHNNNVFTEYENYFLDAMGNGTEVYAKEYNKTNINTVTKTFSRMWYSVEDKKKLEKLITDIKPDIIYILHYQNKISPSIFDAAVRFKVPVVHRLSDFGQICANSFLYRPQQKVVCEKCIQGSKWNAVKYKCVQDSYTYSAIKAAALVIAERFVHVHSKINAFVVPSSFTLNKMVESGLDRKKMNHIPTFFSSESFDADEKVSYQPFALYTGRIVQEKGLFTLIKSFVGTNFNLKIIGFSTDGFQEVLETYLEGKHHNIEFLGSKKFKEMMPYLKTCAFTIVPSENYDNFPNAVLESYAFKKAVIATDLGSLKEMVVNAKTGLLFEAQNELDLQTKVGFLLKNPSLCEEYGNNAFTKLLIEYGAEMHYKKLMNVFETVIEKNIER